jgi:hypothetical protein
MQEVCRTSDLEIGWGYVKQVGLVGGDRLLFGSGLGLIEGPASVRGGGDESAVGAAGGATAERRRSGRAASGRERPGDGGAVPVRGGAGARESVRVLEV